MVIRETAASGLTREEALALVIALAAHAGLIAALTLAPPGRTVPPLPERMTVTVSDVIAERSATTEPDAQAAPDVAPELGEAQPQPQPQPQTVPEPEPAPAPQVTPPKPSPPLPQPLPKPIPRPQPPRVQTQPAPPKTTIKMPPAKTPSAKAAPAKTPAAKAPPARPTDDRPSRAAKTPAGGSRIGDDFLKGVRGATDPGTARTPPAETMSPQIAASLNSEVQRQIRSRGQWQVPQGVDTDKLITLVTFRLAQDGSLDGQPTARTIGINNSNQAQVKQHQERAIRAVRLTVPFQLPAKFYDGWKEIQAKFDRKLAL